MKVKVSLEASPFVLCGNEVKPFPTGFSTISFVPFEPLCPFCGKHLKAASCRCEKFTDAIAKFKALYDETPSDVYITRVPEVPVATMLFIEDAHITTENVLPPQNVFTLFDEGCRVQSSPLKSDVWFVSSGELIGDCLTFYVRQKKSEQLQRCSVCDIDKDLLSRFSIPDTISLCKYKQKFEHRFGMSNHLGNYAPVSEQVEIASLSYDDFLQKLQTM